MKKMPFNFQHLDEQAKKRIEKFILLVLVGVQFIHIVDFMIIMPLGQMLMSVFEINAQRFGLLVSCYTFFAGISGFTTSFYIDGYDRRKVLIFFMTGFLLGALACASADSYEAFLFARSISGIFGGVLSTICLSIVGDVFPYERRGQAMGILMSAVSVASIVGVPLGIYIANNFNWHGVFMFLALLSVILLILIVIFIPQLRGHIGEFDNRLKDAIIFYKQLPQNPSALWALGLVSSLFIGQFMVIPFIAPYMMGNVGLDQSEISYLYIFGGIASVITSPVIGRASDRYGKQLIFRIAFILSLITMFLVTHMGTISPILALTITSCYFIFSMGRAIPAMAIVTQTIKAKNRGKFMGLVSAVQQLSTSIGSFIVGLIVFRSSEGKILYYGKAGIVAIMVSCGALFFIRKIKIQSVAD